MSLKRSRQVVLVDDNPDYGELMQRVFAQVRPDDELHWLRSIRPLVEQLNQKDSPLPDLIILDLMMPEPDGLQALYYLKQAPDLKSIPVIMWSGSEANHDALACYRAGANSFIQKPEGMQALRHFVEVTSTYWLTVVQLPSATTA